MRKPKRTPLLESAMTKAAERDDFFASAQADNGIMVLVSSGDIEGESDADKQACLLQIGTGMSGYTCAYLVDEEVRQLITNLTNYLACKPRNGVSHAG